MMVPSPLLSLLFPWPKLRTAGLAWQDGQSLLPGEFHGEAIIQFSSVQSLSRGRLFATP